MLQPRVVAITGVAGHWGSRLARRLLDEPGYQVIGVDVKQPERSVEGLDFVLADVRNPALADLFRGERVDTLCHLKLKEVIPASDASYEANVGGTTKVLQACARAGVRQVVFKSSTTVYGANPTNSAFLPESHPLRGSRRYAYNRHLVEIEGFLATFSQQHPEVGLAVLRFANIVGPTADTPMSRAVRSHWAVRPMGFDPLMQVIHEDDVVEALAFAVFNGVQGVFNVAAEGLLPLNRIMAMTRTLPVPILQRLAEWGVRRKEELRDHLPIELDYLRYRWVADLTKMREEMGFSPRLAADEAVRAMVGPAEGDGAAPDGPGLSEEQLQAAIEARRQRRATARLAQEEAEYE
jgi:UDP-glucose 4-epimerase